MDLALNWPGQGTIYCASRRLQRTPSDIRSPFLHQRQPTCSSLRVASGGPNAYSAKVTERRILRRYLQGIRREFRNGLDSILADVLDGVEAPLQFASSLLLCFDRDSLAGRFAILLDPATGETEVIPPHSRLLEPAGFRILLGWSVDCHDVLRFDASLTVLLLNRASFRPCLVQLLQRGRQQPPDSIGAAFESVHETKIVKSCEKYFVNCEVQDRFGAAIQPTSPRSSISAIVPVDISC